jgi:hypothetical protein
VADAQTAEAIRTAAEEAKLSPGRNINRPV